MVTHEAIRSPGSGGYLYGLFLYQSSLVLAAPQLSPGWPPPKDLPAPETPPCLPKGSDLVTPSSYQAGAHSVGWCLGLTCQ